MYRLAVRFSRGWKLGIVSYQNEEMANERLEELVSLGQKRAKIKIISESKIFN